MPRYLSQSNQTDCGPTAVLNALKWIGLHTTFNKHAKIARRLCKWKPNDGGTYTTNILNAFRTMCRDKASVTSYACTTGSVIEKLNRGCAAFMTHRAHDNISHISFVMKIEEIDAFCIINSQLIYGGPTVFYLEETELKKILRRKTTDAYIVTKK